MADTYTESFDDLLHRCLAHISEWDDAGRVTRRLLDNPDEPVVGDHLDAAAKKRYYSVADIMDETPHDGAVIINDIGFALGQMLASLLYIKEGDYTPEQFTATANYILNCVNRAANG